MELIQGKGKKFATEERQMFRTNGFSYNDATKASHLFVSVGE
jgi:hypothetical protein